MKIHKLKFILLLIAAMIFSFLLVPGKQERALMFLKDMNYKQAQGLYEDLLQKKDSRRNNIVPLTRIYLGEGDIISAVKLHEQYLKDYPDDTEVWNMLANLYRDTQRPYDHIEALNQVIKRQPDLEHYIQLVNLYEQLGIKDQQLINALTQIIKLDPERESEMRELIKLQAGMGQLQEANSTMEQYIRRFEDKINNNLAELRLLLLLSTGRLNEAYDWAEKWLAKHKNSFSRFVALLYSGGLNSNVDAAFKAAVAVHPKDMPDWLIAAVMKEGWDKENPNFIESFASCLSENRVSEYPTIMAMMSFKQADNATFNTWLAKTEQRKSALNIEQQARLMMLYFMSGSASKGLNLLSQLAKRPAIPAAQLTQVVPLILKSNFIEEGQAIFQALIGDRDDPGIVSAWAALTTATGSDQMVTDWLDNADTALTQKTFIALYQIAIEKSHYQLAASIAERIYAKYENIEKLTKITSAYLQDNKQLSANKQIIALIKEQMQRYPVSKPLRRELAFQLLDMGEKKAAIEEFKHLANAEGPQGINVKQLLYIWGPSPGAKALDWIEMRAKKAPAQQLASWWKHLLQAGGGQRVTKMAKQIDTNIPVEAEEVLINILTADGDISVVNTLLRQRSVRTSNPVNLERLAMQANYAGLAKTEELIWQRLHDRDSTNSKAIKALGLAAFERGDMATAEHYLSRYSNITGGDWENLFYLGEVFYIKKRYKKAQEYYRKSLEFIEVDAWPKKSKRIVKAYLFYRLGNVKQAIAQYDQLIKRYPGDMELRADYSTMLLDIGHLDKARKILGKK